MVTEIWKELGALSEERGWADLAAGVAHEAAAGRAATLLVLTADEVAEPDQLVAWCAGTAPAVAVSTVTFSEINTRPDQEWWADKLIVALPAPVPEEAAARLFAETRRRWADRPPGTCVIVSILTSAAPAVGLSASVIGFSATTARPSAPVAESSVGAASPTDVDLGSAGSPVADVEAVVRRVDRTLLRLIGEPAAQHLVWGPGEPPDPLAARVAADTERLAAFVTAPVEVEIRDRQRRQLARLLDQRLADQAARQGVEGPEAAGSGAAGSGGTGASGGRARRQARVRAWRRRTEAELLAGIDAVEQELNQAI
ncbi:MAG: hypothetical protein ABW046_15010, partial [Actinoplanes sp.]